MNDEIKAEFELIKSLLLKQEIATKEILTLKEASIYLSVSKSFLYKKTSTNQIPHYVPNSGKVYFKRSELDEWIFKG